MKGKVLVAGAGHVGLYAACAFAMEGFEVHLFDQLDEAGVIRRYAWADSIEPSAVVAMGLPIPEEVNGRLKGELVKKTGAENTDYQAKETPEELAAKIAAMQAWY